MLLGSARFRTLVLAGVSTSALVLGASFGWRHRPPATSFADLLVLGAMALGAVGCLWLWLQSMALLSEAWSGQTGPIRTAPALRRLVALSAGVAVSGALAAPALAQGGNLDGVRLPQRPLGSAPVSTNAAPTPAAAVHVVVPGDSLWSIAQRSGARGTPAIAAEVLRLHQLNREVIGDDPNVLVPGQRLRTEGVAR